MHIHIYIYRERERFIYIYIYIHTHVYTHLYIYIYICIAPDLLLALLRGLGDVLVEGGDAGLERLSNAVIYDSIR